MNPRSDILVCRTGRIEITISESQKKKIRITRNIGINKEYSPEKSTAYPVTTALIRKPQFLTKFFHASFTSYHLCITRIPKLDEQGNLPTKQPTRPNLIASYRFSDDLLFYWCQ
ncbi:6090_t:CDS:2 [Gigaspora margarita]|uniref:6090_t:CDS:1 n=1 Tax=Gigaspora margarita TaxID=4874 RepID=A0ABN7UWN9_GIGMA|nr:6090_t:CDS:2 [Gigaspora margarita]